MLTKSDRSATKGLRGVGEERLHGSDRPVGCNQAAFYDVGSRGGGHSSPTRSWFQRRFAQASLLSWPSVSCPRALIAPPHIAGAYAVHSSASSDVQRWEIIAGSTIMKQRPAPIRRDFQIAFESIVAVV